MEITIDLPIGFPINNIISLLLEEELEMWKGKQNRSMDEGAQDVGIE